MKNIKLIGATAAVILASTVAGIMAPSVMAQVAVNNGLEYLKNVSPSELSQAYTIDVDFEGSLTEAKNAKDLKVISEKNAIAEFSNESDMSMVMGKTIMPNDPGYVEAPKIEMIGNGTMEDPYRPKDGVTLEYQVDPRVTKYLQYTNPAGKKVTLGIDKNNLPIIMKVSQ